MNLQAPETFSLIQYPSLALPLCVPCQVRAREEELLNLTSLHTATKAAADKRIAALEGRVTKLLDANRWGPWGAAAAVV